MTTTTENYDVVVYGNTWAAVNAACAAGQQGCRVALVSPYNHIGGCIANGLSSIDLGRYGIHGAGYMTDEFFRRNSALSGSRIRLPRVSPVRAELIYGEMLKFYGVYVRVGLQITSATKSGTNISSFTCMDGTNTTIFNGLVFVDGTEEGDLAASSGVTMTYGRESNNYFSTNTATGGVLVNPPTGSTWNLSTETLGGFMPIADTFTPMDCYDSSGSLINSFSSYPSTSPGEADLGIQAYCYRLCATKSSYNRRRWPKPEGYDESLFEYRIRQIPSDQTNWLPFTLAQCVDGKYDINGDFGIPMQWQWPNASYSERNTIAQTIYNEQAGWMWFLANDPSISTKVQDYVNTYGPCIDEFQDASSTFATGWPYEVYVREARRMYGQYIMTQSDLQTNTTKADVIACGFYSMDNHTNKKLATTVNGTAGYILDSFGASDINRQVSVAYHIPWRAMLPVQSECTNLMVPVAASMSSVAGSSMRIDMHKSNAASACGYAAALSVNTSTPLNNLSVSDIQSGISSLGQVLSYTAP